MHHTYIMQHLCTLFVRLNVRERCSSQSTVRSQGKPNHLPVKLNARPLTPDPLQHGFDGTNRSLHHHQSRLAICELWQKKCAFIWASDSLTRRCSRQPLIVLFISPYSVLSNYCNGHLLVRDSMDHIAIATIYVSRITLQTCNGALGEPPGKNRPFGINRLCLVLGFILAVVQICIKYIFVTQCVAVIDENHI